MDQYTLTREESLLLVIDIQDRLARDLARAHHLQHVQRQAGHALCVIILRIWKTAHRHVRISNGLDLLQAVFLHQPVKFGEQAVEQFHQRQPH